MIVRNMVDEKVQPESAPDPADGDDGLNPMDVRQIQVSRIVGLIFAAIVAAGFMVGMVIAYFASGLGLVWYCVAAGGLVLSLFLFWLGIYWPLYEHHHFRWRLNESGLEIRRGVIWRHRISIPVARVQHADVSQGPLQRSFGLGKLTIHTAGTENASIELEGIAHQQAIELRDQIVNQRKSGDVV